MPAESLRPPRRQDDWNSKRKRPLQSQRRKAPRDAGIFVQVPQLAQNFNLSRHTMREHVLRTLGPSARAINFKSYYRNAARTISASTGALEAPLNIAKEGHEDLLAEYLATPGKRYDAFERRLTREQMYLVGLHLGKVISEYRRRLRKTSCAC